MKLSHITISVKDLNESLKFYQGIIGLTVKRRFSAGESEIVFLGDGETEIELIYNRLHTDIFFGQSISLGFQVASVQETLSNLNQKGIGVGEIIQPNPSVQFFFTTDPNGVRIQFVEYAEKTSRSW
ncbi:MAG: VOC family protein [Oscillospiraceae bacterium]|nr:VOC family protein [Oscillospiraceae bacterium]